MYSEQSGLNTPVFIIGLPRSGSTLWSKVLSSHPDVTQFAEMHFLTIWHRDFRYVLKHHAGDLSREQDVARLIETIFSQEPVTGMGQGFWFWYQIRSLEEKGLKQSLYKRIMDSEDREIGTLFRIIIEEATRCRGSNRTVVKFPVYPVYIGRLTEWWPGCRIVHVSRDPRALAASKTNDPAGVAGLIRRYPRMKSVFQFSGKYFAIFQYILASRVHARFNDLPNYSLFLYEDLVSRPDEVIRELCEFCQLDFDESMLNPPAGQPSSITGGTVGGFDPSRSNGWRKVLSPRESKFIKNITRSSMHRFGYKPGE